MFRSLTYLKSGNDIQRRVLKVINELRVFHDLAKFHPVLCGTVPIGIDVPGSDLDIIMEVRDLQMFRDKLITLYGSYDTFVIKEKVISGMPTVKANFAFGGFEFELFGQPRAVEQQNAYRHMIVEHHLLQSNPLLRSDIIRLKERGIKTEPAFALALGLEGDPYEELLVLGRKLEVLH